MKKKAYPAYKDSGIEWLGKIPEGWRTSRAKFCSRINMGQSPNSEDCNLDGIGFPFLQGNAEFGSISPTPRQYCEVPRKIAHKGDLLISVRAPVGALNVADQEYGIGRGLCGIFVDESRLKSDFVWYLLHHVRTQLNINVTGSTYDAVSAKDVGNTIFPIPPLVDQSAIATFLNRETERIDTLIAKKERQIELLQEKRIALISHTVTKGLNPNAKMKNSGIEWLGEIPRHWEIKRLKYMASINDESLPETTDPGYEFSYVDIGSVDAVKGIVDKELYLFENAPSRARRIVRDGDTIVSTVRTYLRAIAPICEPDDHLIVSTGFAVVRPRKIRPKYLSYALRSPYFVETVVSRSTGVSYPAINASEVGTIEAPVPALDEQRAIAAFLDRETTRIDGLIKRVEESIAMLREYRAALISAMVTGKIDVRKEVA